MKITRIVSLALSVVIACSSFVAAQEKDGAKFGKFTIKSADKPMTVFETGIPNLSPSVGSAYSISMASNIENGNDGSDIGSALTIGAIVDAIMDGNTDVIGTDLADVFGAEAPNDVISGECLESLGVDDATGLFRLRLTLVIETTGTEPQFDSLDMDLQDPNDIGFDADGDGTITLAEGAGDGVTGKGPDGVYGTMDDVVAPDGFFDTGDGAADAPFPLLPPNVVAQFDLDGDMDPTNDPFSSFSGITLFVGIGGAGSPVTFDDIGTVESVFIGFNDADGNAADIDGDGVADDFSGLDLLTIPVFADDFNPPLPIGATWDGTIGATLGVDNNLCSINENTSGNVYQMTFQMTYLSAVENTFSNELCSDDAGPCEFEVGDVNQDTEIDILDVAPFVDAITGKFVCEADIDGSGEVDILDVAPFVALITGG